MIEFFLVIGLTLFMGFAATVIFDRTKISQVLILMLFGFILGPATGIIDSGEESIIISISQFMGTLALIVLLFDGGMMLDIFSVVKAIPKSTFFTFITFIITLILITLFAMFGLGWPMLHGLLLGAVVGGISSAIVIAMVDKAGVTEESKALLTIESSITDALCIIGAMVVIEVIVSSSIGIGEIGHMLLGSFLIAAFVGVLCAVIWIALSNKFGIEQYAYMLTLAMVFIVYAVAQGVDSNGGFAVFIFGLVLGNARVIAKKLKLNTDSLVSPIVRIFQEEVTFFVRTFFFVYMGLLLAPSYFTVSAVLIAVAVTVLIVLARMIGEKLSLGKDPAYAKDKPIITYMVPRGLAAAVLATLPIIYLTPIGIEIPEFQPIVFGIIVLTNVVATGGIFFFGGERPLWPRIRSGLIPYMGKSAELLFGDEIVKDSNEERETKENGGKTPKQPAKAPQKKVNGGAKKKVK